MIAMHTVLTTQNVALFQHAGVETGEGQGANEGVVHDFERQARERHIIIRAARDVTGFGFVTGFEAHVINNVQRAGQVVDHGVEQRLNAFVLECGTAQNRNEVERQSALAQQSAQCCMCLRLMVVSRQLYRVY